MKNRRAIVFFLFWSALFAFALFVLSFSEGRDSDSPGKTLSSFDVRNVDRVDIRRRTRDGAIEHLSIVSVDGRWHIDDPVSAEADEEAVKRLVETLVFSEPGDSLSGADMAGLGRSPHDFGLAAPRGTVTVSAKGEQETFSIGKRTAARNEVYISRKGRDGVFTVPAKIAEEVMRPTVEFRRRRLFTFRSSDVMGIGLKDAGEPLTRLSKNDGQWRISDPVDAPADRQMVEDLLVALCSAHVMDYVTDAGPGHGLGDGEGFSVSLRDTFGAVEKVVFGVPDGTNAVWALTSEGAVVHVGREVLERCRSRQKTLEDTRVFPVEAPAVTTFSVSMGFPAYVISRAGSSSPWLMVSPVDGLADAEIVGSLLESLLSLKGGELVSEADENAVLVSVGTSVTNFSARYVSKAALVRDLRFADLLDKTLLRCCRGRVRRIMVKSSAGNEWNAASSDELIDLLDKGVRAERVECIALQPKEFNRCGFAHPAYMISFELNDDTSSMKRMLIGGVAPGGGRYAMIGGMDAAFVLSASAVSVLVKPPDTAKEQMK